jgi:protein-S-isoprenylcysteine O-methyltransferase Ste14
VPTSTTLGSLSSAEQDRGGKWVAAQIVLMVVTLICGFVPPGWGSLSVAFAVLGALIGFLGAALVVWSWRTLGQSATPYPRPVARGRLVDSGPYAFVRHPVYTGGILFFLGYSLATSPVALVPLAALVLLWRNKASLEEEWLMERYEDYDDYRRRVVGAFVPRSLRVDSDA